ncbi:MAG: PQQ-dependent sugar dehydrogenase, partial [Pyrinomonadaceae bacterium]
MKFKRASLFFVLALTVCLSTSLTRHSASRTATATSLQDAGVELPNIVLNSPVTGLSQPVSITHAGDGSGRLFIVEQGGRIRIIKNNAVLPAPFLDISNRVSTGGERGLLGLAFPPAYASNGRFYVNYTNAAGDTVIARYRRSVSNPDLADAGSEGIVLTIAQPFANHNGGQLAFGPRDNFLYIGMGDGGDAGDPGNRAQNTNMLLGKLLRLDVESGQPATYNIPASNPFVNRAGFRPEIWAIGLRNPWRFSFDRQTGDLYIADVGQGSWEELNFQQANDSGGENYGWRIMEGMHCFNPTSCSAVGLTLPVWEYNHALGCSVTGGYVYRGAAFPRMQGLYFYSDFCSGRIWALHREGASWVNTQLLDTTLSVSTFGEDESGGLYLADYNGGTIYTVADQTPTPTPTPTPSAQATIGFSAPQFEISEGGGSAVVTVTRTAQPTQNGTDSVDYTIADGSAKQKSDYTLVAGRLVFGPGDVSKTISVPVTEDAFLEGDESATLALSNPSSGARLGAQGTATLLIRDNDIVNGSSNPIDNPDNFVSQHYHDFLNRQSDADGQNFWTAQILACGGQPSCVEEHR